MDRTPARKRQDARKQLRKERSREPRREPRGPRLDVPKETRRPLVRRPQLDSDRFGRFAETFARFMGTARFLLYMTLFVSLWLLWNWLAPGPMRFDDYPFIFLTLMLSLQASYAAPLILLAQNRQEDRDRVIGEQDRRPTPGRTPTWSSWPARWPRSGWRSARWPPATTYAPSCAR